MISLNAVLSTMVRCFSWWHARLTELMVAGRAEIPRAGIVVDVGCGGEVAALVWRRNGCERPIGIDVAARLAGRNAVLLRPPAGSILHKRHIIHAAAPGQMRSLLRHEIGRITPFVAEELFWRWDLEAGSTGQSKAAVMLTMVPQAALAVALAELNQGGIRVDGVLVGSAGRPRLLPIGGGRDQARGAAVVRGLALACVCLGLVAAGLPVGLLALARYQTEIAIAELRPAVAEVEVLRHRVAAAEVSRNILHEAAERGGDVLRFLASVSRLVPDDTFLTDISVRQRHITFSGRSTSAPALVSILSADPAFRAVAFSAPVTRVEGAARDIFSIRAEMGKS